MNRAKSLTAEGIRARYLDMCGMDDSAKHSQNPATEEDLRRVADATSETIIHLAEALDGTLADSDGLDFTAFVLGICFGIVVAIGICSVAMWLL